MIISRTPFRISFFGGGTDYPAWFKDNPGAVLATSIDKYCYITARYLPPFFDHRSRIIYSKMEHVQTVDEINHPAVRETLRFLNIHQGIEIHHDGDLPARTGLGSSSAFTVGLLNSLYALKGIMPTKEQLAREAIHIEQDMIRENVGCQDQVLAAHGGFNYIEFGGDGHLSVRKITVTKENLAVLHSHMMLFFTGFSRTASEIAVHQIQNIPKRKKELTAMQAMVMEAVRALNACDWEKFGELLHESWLLKRTLSDKITTGHIDGIYERALKAGALGGKLLGAGGGGFVLIYARPDQKEAVRAALSDLLEIPFKFETLGSQIIFYQPNSGVVV
ncbi:MAG: kinase [Candidatus Omnitrophica bacterium]|nr:kinase [Candidatus Omnitrophota bacterium]